MRFALGGQAEDQALSPARVDSASSAARKSLRNVQGLRGLAAFIVVFAHVSGVGGVEERLFGHSWLPWLELPANTGVDLFFVISGLIMVVTTWHTFDAPHSPRRFLWRRVTRIYPLYWVVSTPIIVLFLVHPSSVTWASGQDPQILQSYLLLPREDRMPLVVAWSLVYEMYFYLLFTAVLLLGRRFFGWAIGAWALATIVLHYTVGDSGNAFLDLISSLLSLEFVFGVTIGYAVIRGWLWRPGRVAVIGAVLFVAMCIALAVSGGHAFPSEEVRVLGPGLVMAVLVYAAVGLELRRDAIAPSFLRKAGDSSYSLYLVHVPALTVLVMVLSRLLPTTPAVHVAVLVLAPVYVIVASRVCYRLLERPLQTLFRGGQPGRHAAQRVMSAAVVDDETAQRRSAPG